jgi:type IV fimbrial biogenesis protein FimT
MFPVAGSKAKHMSRTMPNSRRVACASGFTLVELMVTIAIATILMLVAAPSFVQFQRNAQLSETVSEFVSAVNAARGNAMKQGRNTRLEPQSGTNWSSGWRVYADVNWDNAYTAGTDELVFESPVPDAGLTITTPTGSSLEDGYLLFNGSGYPKLTGGGLATGKIVMANAYRSSTINIDGTGRVRSCKTGSTGC